MSKIIILLFSFILLFSCKKEEDLGVIDNNNLTPSQEMNLYIKKIMDENYLWTNNLNIIDPLKEKDPKVFFNKILFKEKDHWSMIIDDYMKFKNDFQEENLTCGMILNMAPDQKSAIVEFVYKDSPAAAAGIKGADRIIAINGKAITSNNLNKINQYQEVSITYGRPNMKGSFSDILNPQTTKLIPKKMKISPIMLNNIIKYKNKKVGYLLYKRFNEKYNSNLSAIFKYYKDNKITDLIIDLRYNNGGEATAAKHLASLIVSENKITNDDIFTYWTWNNIKQNYYKNNDQSFLKWYFKKNTSVNLNLKKITIITYLRTASASELLINSLRPYMKVTLVGTQTRGKYVGSLKFQPTSKDLSDKAFKIYKNWAIYPIVVSSSNNKAESFKNGFSPDYSIIDLMKKYELGNQQEPILKKALETL